MNIIPGGGGGSKAYAESLAQEDPPGRIIWKPQGVPQNTDTRDSGVVQYGSLFVGEGDYLTCLVESDATGKAEIETEHMPVRHNRRRIIEFDMGWRIGNGDINKLNSAVIKIGGGGINNDSTIYLGVINLGGEGASSDFVLVTTDSEGRTTGVKTIYDSESYPGNSFGSVVFRGVIDMNPSEGKTTLYLGQFTEGSPNIWETYSLDAVPKGYDKGKIRMTTESDEPLVSTTSVRYIKQYFPNGYEMGPDVAPET